MILGASRDEEFLALLVFSTSLLVVSFLGVSLITSTALSVTRKTSNDVWQYAIVVGLAAVNVLFLPRRLFIDRRTRSVTWRKGPLDVQKWSFDEIKWAKYLPQNESHGKCLLAFKRGEPLVLYSGTSLKCRNLEEAVNNFMELQISLD